MNSLYLVLLPDVAPMTGPLAAIESFQRAPTGPVAHGGAKVIHAMNGRARIETPIGELSLSRGDVLVLAPGPESSTTPDPWLRTWTVYVDEAFFRQYMRWAIPEDAPLIQGVPPSSWDGDPLHLRLDPIRLAWLEPILRRMSLTIATDSYTAAATALALFAQAVEVVTPALLVGGRPSRDPRRAARMFATTCVFVIPGGLPRTRSFSIVRTHNAALDNASMGFYRRMHPPRARQRTDGAIMRHSTLCIDDLRRRRSLVISRQEAARALGVDPRTITVGIEDGTIPSDQLGGRVVIPHEKFLALFADGSSEDRP